MPRVSTGADFLCRAVLSPSTSERYRAAAQDFLRWCDCPGQALPHLDDVDDLLWTIFMKSTRPKLVVPEPALLALFTVFIIFSPSFEDSCIVLSRLERLGKASPVEI